MKDECTVVGCTFPHLRDGSCSYPKFFFDLTNEGLFVGLAFFDPPARRSPITREDRLEAAFYH